jgi:hypothetical protein
MWTDINTKPKQGKVFRKFRGHVMGIPTEYNDDDYKKEVINTPSEFDAPCPEGKGSTKGVCWEKSERPNPDRCQTEWRRIASANQNGWREALEPRSVLRLMGKTLEVWV